MFVETYLSNRNVPSPASQLTRCGNSRCKSEDIFAFDGEVFCQACDWNSIEAHVEAQMRSHTKSWTEMKAPAPIPNADTQKQFVGNDTRSGSLTNELLFPQSVEVTESPMIA